MNRTGEFIAENIVNHALAGDTRQSVKRRRNDKQSKMRFASLAGASMACMEV